MNNQFDELTKSMAQSVTRRAALKKFGAGLAGMALACFGLANRARAATYRGFCQVEGAWFTTDVWYNGRCVDINGCISNSSTDCPAYGTSAGSVAHGVKGK